MENWLLKTTKKVNIPTLIKDVIQKIFIVVIYYAIVGCFIFVLTQRNEFILSVYYSKSTILIVVYFVSNKPLIFIILRYLLFTFRHPVSVLSQGQYFKFLPVDFYGLRTNILTNSPGGRKTELGSKRPTSGVRHSALRFSISHAVEVVCRKTVIPYCRQSYLYCFLWLYKNMREYIEIIKATNQQQ